MISVALQEGAGAPGMAGKEAPCVSVSSTRTFEAVLTQVSVISGGRCDCRCCVFVCAFLYDSIKKKKVLGYQKQNWAELPKAGLGAPSQRACPVGPQGLSTSSSSMPRKATSGNTSEPAGRPGWSTPMTSTAFPRSR